jgi:hypothetical protein
MKQINVDVSRLDGLFGMLGCGWWWPLGAVAVLTELPTSIHLDERGRLHNEKGPAIAYTDGWGVYAVHGVRVPKWVIMEPDRLTAASVTAEANAEVRRVMIGLMGWQLYLTEAGAIEVSSDECGTLLSLPVPDDEPIVAVRVRNSTREPDGSWKDYLLRVDPKCQTAREGVAWTFGLSASEYHPSVET